MIGPQFLSVIRAGYAQLKLKSEVGVLNKKQATGKQPGVTRRRRRFPSSHIVVCNAAQIAQNVNVSDGRRKRAGELGRDRLKRCFHVQCLTEAPSAVVARFSL